MRVADLEARNVNLADIRLVRKVGGTLEESELVEGLVLDNHVCRTSYTSFTSYTFCSLTRCSVLLLPITLEHTA